MRRKAQILALRPDLVVRDLRGNVDTRLAALGNGEYDGIVLAAAGLIRLDLRNRIDEFLDPGEVLPAPGQGPWPWRCGKGTTWPRSSATPCTTPLLPPGPGGAGFP